MDSHWRCQTARGKAKDNFLRLFSVDNQIAIVTPVTTVTISKQCESCFCCPVSCTHTHPHHTTVQSGSVSIRGQSAAAERDEPHAPGWLSDVTASVQAQDGGAQGHPSFSSTQGTAVEFSRTRIARDLDCGVPHPEVYFTTTAERGCKSSSSRQFGDPSFPVANDRALE